MRHSDKIMCAAFVVLSLFSTWGVLYAFWLSFETFPVDSRVWDAKLDEVCTLPRASLSVFKDGDDTHVCIDSVGDGDFTAFAANSSVFHECTLLGTLVYLQGVKGGLCLAFQSKALVDAFVASIGLTLEHLATPGDAGSSDTETSTSGRTTPEDDDDDDVYYLDDDAYYTPGVCGDMD